MHRDGCSEITARRWSEKTCLSSSSSSSSSSFSSIDSCMNHYFDAAAVMCDLHVSIRLAVRSSLIKKRTGGSCHPELETGTDESAQRLTRKN